MRKLIFLVVLFMFLVSCASLQRAKGLFIDELFLAESVTTYQDFVVKDDYDFAIYEKFWLYFEINNLTRNDGVSIIVVLTLIGPGDEVIWERPWLDYIGPIKEPFAALGMYIPPGTPQGEYSIKIEFTDRLSNETAQDSISFNVIVTKEI